MYKISEQDFSYPTCPQIPPTIAIYLQDEVQTEIWSLFCLLSSLSVAHFPDISSKVPYGGFSCSLAFPTKSYLSLISQSYLTLPVCVRVPPGCSQNIDQRSYDFCHRPASLTSCALPEKVLKLNTMPGNREGRDVKDKEKAKGKLRQCVAQAISVECHLSLSSETILLSILGSTLESEYSELSRFFIPCTLSLSCYLAFSLLKTCFCFSPCVLFDCSVLFLQHFKIGRFHINTFSIFLRRKKGKEGGKEGRGQRGRKKHLASQGPSLRGNTRRKQQRGFALGERTRPPKHRSLRPLSRSVTTYSSSLGWGRGQRYKEVEGKIRRSLTETLGKSLGLVCGNCQVSGSSQTPGVFTPAPALGLRGPSY